MGYHTLLLLCLSRKKQLVKEVSEKEAQKASQSAGVLWGVHTAHLWDHALLNSLNHPSWALSIKSAFSCQGWSAVSWALLLSQGGTRSPTGEGVLVQLDGAPGFQHSVSPGLQLPELAPLTAYCVHGRGFSTSVNLHNNTRAPPLRSGGYCFFPAEPGSGSSGIRS